MAPIMLSIRGIEKTLWNSVARREHRQPRPQPLQTDKRPLPAELPAAYGALLHATLSPSTRTSCGPPCPCSPSNKNGGGHVETRMAQDKNTGDLEQPEGEGEECVLRRWLWGEVGEVFHFRAVFSHEK